MAAHFRHERTRFLNVERWNVALQEIFLIQEILFRNEEFAMNDVDFERLFFHLI
jgi:hypothetical protein